MDDLTNIKGAILGDEPAMNGATNPRTSAREHISIIWETLSKYQSKLNDLQSVEESHDNLTQKTNGPLSPASVVLSLRSQTDQGIRQLFSGLPEKADTSDINGRHLPNGFELTELSKMGKESTIPTDARKFGDVFTPHRNTKSLDIPRPHRNPRIQGLDFVPPFENILPANRTDHRYAALSTGSWLKYATSDRLGTDTKNLSKDNSEEKSGLFKAAFSSFAPSTDNSSAAVTNHARSQQWWKKYGRPNRHASLFSRSSQLTQQTPVENDGHDFEKEIEKLIADFIPENDQAVEAEEVLDEISELVETLSSYQSMRNLEVAKGPTSASKPTSEEYEIHELLRSQLQLLISSLPPFAVAKLNGDQLEALNISTHILTSTPEFTGTSQIDDYTMRRNRAAQTAAASVAGRTAPPTQPRPMYGTPTGAYNAQARTYNSNMTNSTYAARPTSTMYSTLRPGAGTQATPYPQSTYRPGGATIHTPSVQQFQRPMVNGYGPGATPTPQPSFVQRPSQPGYQQRAQEASSYQRGDSPQKPLVNGQAQQYQARPSLPPNGSYSTATPPVLTQAPPNADTLKQTKSPDASQTPTGAPNGTIDTDHRPAAEMGTVV